MAIDNAALLVLLAILAAAVVVLSALLLRRARPAAVPDPTAALMQQQLTRLAEQVVQLGAQIPKEVGDSLNRVISQVGARLSENAQVVQKAGADTGRLIADINHRLGELGKSSQQILELGQDIRGLQQVFQAPKIRGGLGEMSLEALLRQIFPAEHFSLQHSFTDGVVVDAALRLPGGLVPIDSKFPLAGFRALLEAGSDEQRVKARRAFGRDVRKHVDDIATKYIRPAEGTLDLALMYIPAENVFYEIIVHDEPGAGEEDLNTYARRRQVIPVSPNTLYAHLQAIAYGLMGLRIEERAREILGNLQALHGDFGLFHETFSLGQKHLKNAQAAFAEAGDRATRLAYQVDQFVRVAREVPEGDSVPSRGLPR
jgi:DNA recombination protein RmuC